jgi:predicted aspartyl protease
LVRTTQSCFVWIAAYLTLLSALVSQADAADQARSTRPIHLALTIVQANPVITITVGDRAVQAIVDTGGGALQLTRDILNSAGAVRLGESIVSTNAMGQHAQQQRYRVPQVTVGDQTFHDIVAVEAAEASGAPIQNTIGRQFLSQFIVVVDYASAAITLWPLETKKLPAKQCGGARIPMERTAEDNQFAVGEFKTTAGHLRLLWDTGATYSTLPVALAKRLSLPTGVRGPGSPPFFEATEFSAAGHKFEPVEFVLLPLELPRDFDGMLGQNFFDRHVVCLDYARREVRVR